MTGPEPVLRIVRGEPTAEELAAVLGALIALAPPPVRERARSRWSAPAGRLGVAPPPGPGSWRASGLPH